MVRLIASCGDNLLSLINNALDFSKIEAGCLELDNQPFALRPCLKEVVDLLSVQATGKGVTLACEVDPRIPEVLVSDVTRVRQILFNLISNSMKFTPSGGRVDVVVTGNQLSEKVENHGHVGAIDPWMFHFTVRDTGEGIPEEKLHRLFRPFSQVDASVSRKHGGTGLGLAICHRLCEMLGGAIWRGERARHGFKFRVHGQGRRRAERLGPDQRRPAARDLGAARRARRRQHFSVERSRQRHVCPHRRRCPGAGGSDDADSIAHSFWRKTIR